MPCAATTRSQPHGLYINYVVCCDYSSPGRIGSASTTLCTATTHLMTAWALPRLRLAPRLLAARLHRLYCAYAVHTDAPSSAQLLVSRSHLLSPCARSLRLVAQLFAARLHWLYCAYAVHRYVSSSPLDFLSVGRTGSRRAPGPIRRAARRRLLRLRRASGCLGTSHGSSSTTSPAPRVRVPRHVARLVVDYSASRRLICRTSGCLGKSRGLSHRSSLTTSPTQRVRVPQHVVWLVTWLVVDYSVRHDFVL
jgi:hypothetical protein